MEQILDRLGSRAHGVVTRRELLAAGVTQAEIRQRLASGALIRRFPGVYRVGHRAPSVEAEYMAAVKACGDGAAVCGLAAAFLWGLIRRPPPVPEITAPGARRVAGIRTHRHRRSARTTQRGIPVTTVAQTLVDVAPRLTGDQLARACHEAQVRWRVRPSHVEQILRRYPNAPGARRLRDILGGEAPTSLSALERKFLRRLREAGLPLPDQTNKLVDEHVVDCRWSSHGLTVELDSYRFHNTRRAFEQDRRRERAAYARGDDHRRYTYGDVFEEPRPMLVELGALLTAPASAASAA